jgi:hypothetical protein
MRTQFENFTKNDNFRQGEFMIEENHQCPKCGREIPSSEFRNHKSKCMGVVDDQEGIYQERYSDLSLSRQNSNLEPALGLNRMSSIDSTGTWDADNNIIRVNPKYNSQ